MKPTSRAHTIQLGIAILCSIAAIAVIAYTVSISKDRQQASRVAVDSAMTPSDASDTAASTTAESTISEASPAGSDMTVATGTTVTWRNIGAYTRTLASDSFPSVSVDAGATYAYTFDQAGSYVIHGSGDSTATILVRD